MATSPAAAADNVVSTQPLRILMPPDETVQIKVVTDPPSQTVAVWVLELSFDPAVVTAESKDCDPINTPAGFVGASGCEVVDTDADGKPDTAKIFGAMITQNNAQGLSQPSTLADITFHVVGQAQECTDFRLRINIHADPEAEETGALVQDGRGCVAGNAPPGGTAEPTVVSPRTSEPTPEGGVTVPPIETDDGNGNGTGDTPAPGETRSDGSTFPPQTGVTTGSAGPSRTGGSNTGGSVNPPEEDDGGGVSSIVWVLLGVGVLAVAGGGAWAFARTRKPPAP